METVQKKIKGQSGGEPPGEGNASEPVYLFLHMPKCAGTTFRVHIENNLAQDEILSLYIDNLRITTRNIDLSRSFNRFQMVGSG